MKINTAPARTSDTSSIERSFGAKLVEQASKFSTSTDQMVKDQKPEVRSDTPIKTNPVSAEVKPVIAETGKTLTAIYSDTSIVRSDTKDADVKAPDMKTDQPTGGVKTDTKGKDVAEMDYLSQIKRA